MMMKTKSVCLALASAVGLAMSASTACGSGILQFDVNTLTGQAYDAAGGTGGAGSASAFGGFSHTGSVQLSYQTGSVLEAIMINGVGQSIAGWTLSGFSGVIDLNNGTVVGGGLFVEVTDGGGNYDTYTASIVPGGGAVIGFTPLVGYTIDGVTFAGAFSGNTFAGVDVSAWHAYSGQLPGAYLNFKYNPNAAGFDNDVDIDIFVAIPLPSAGLMGLAGLGLIGVRRRRN